MTDTRNSTLTFLEMFKIFNMVFKSLKYLALPDCAALSHAIIFSLFRGLVNHVKSGLCLSHYCLQFQVLACTRALLTVQ